MRIWIPRIGDALLLDVPWTFKLHDESRNDGMRDALGHPKRVDWRDNRAAVDVTLPKGVELVVDRVYIRQGADEFSSLSFVVKDHPDADSSIVGERFWAKLDEVNNMFAVHASSGNPVGFGSRAYKTKHRAKADPKVADAAIRRAESKKELESIRHQFIFELQVAQWSRDKQHIKDHLMRLVASSVDRARAEYKAGHFLGWRFDAGSERESRLRTLTYDTTGAKDHVWACRKSKKLAGGTVVRAFRPSSRQFNDQDGGFQVTSKDGKIVTIEPLPFRMAVGQVQRLITSFDQLAETMAEMKQ